MTFYAGQRLRAADLVALIAPGYTSYVVNITGSVSNPSVGNGTLSGWYRRVEDSDEIAVFVFFQIGSTTTVGSGYWIFSLPVNVDGTLYTAFRGTSSMSDISAQERPGSARFTAVTQLVMDNSGGVVTGTSPVVPATGDSYVINMRYKPA